MQEHALPFDGATGAGVQDVAGNILQDLPTDEFPHFTEMIIHHALQPG
jgi:hypothetical protein